jgi:hypothetical protein
MLASCQPSHLPLRSAVHDFSAGSKVCQRLRYSVRATRQSEIGLSIRGFLRNPTAQRSISYWIEGDVQISLRQARLALKILMFRRCGESNSFQSISYQFQPQDVFD